MENCSSTCSNVVCCKSWPWLHSCRNWLWICRGTQAQHMCCGAPPAASCTVLHPVLNCTRCMCPAPGGQRLAHPDWTFCFSCQDCHNLSLSLCSPILSRVPAGSTASQDSHLVDFRMGALSHVTHVTVSQMWQACSHACVMHQTGACAQLLCKEAACVCGSVRHAESAAAQRWSVWLSSQSATAAAV